MRAAGVGVIVAVLVGAREAVLVNVAVGAAVCVGSGAVLLVGVAVLVGSGVVVTSTVRVGELTAAEQAVSNIADISRI